MTEGVARKAGLDQKPCDAERLAGFCRVATGDVDEAADAIGRIFCPHVLKPLRAASPGFYARHNCAAFAGFSINYVAYGGSVSIDPGCLERFILVQLPLRGSARIETGARAIASAPGVAASLLSPTVPTRMSWNDCAQLILLVERNVLEQRAAALAGKPARAVEFDPVVDLSTPAAQALRTQMEALASLAEGVGPKRSLSPLAAANWLESLLDSLLTGQRHGWSDAIRTFQGHAETLPHTLQRARNISKHPPASRSISRRLPQPPASAFARCSLASSAISECRSQRCCSSFAWRSSTRGSRARRLVRASSTSPSISASPIWAGWPGPIDRNLAKRHRRRCAACIDQASFRSRWKRKAPGSVMAKPGAFAAHCGEGVSAAATVRSDGGGP